MKQLDVKNTIDNTIKKAISDGDCFEKIISDLKTRKFNISKMYDKEVKELNIDLADVKEDILSKRAKYALYYKREAESRIGDLEWMVLNEAKFGLKKIKLFQLVQFKDKLRSKSINQS